MMGNNIEMEKKDMDWKSRIPGCFGHVDYKFAIHPLDEDRSFNLLCELRKEDVSWGQIEAEVKNFLEKGGCSKSHIDEQLVSVERHIRPWLRY